MANKNPHPELGNRVLTDKEFLKALIETSGKQYYDYEFRDFLQILRATIVHELAQGNEISIPGLVHFKRRFYKGKPRKSLFTGGIYDPTSITLQAKVTEALKQAFRQELTEQRLELQKEINPDFVPIRNDDFVYTTEYLNEVRNKRRKERTEKAKIVAEEQQAEVVVDTSLD